ncbi:MAG: rhomboid family intramembrane serine protease [Anoxybacillus sp.]|nr:rhomboid family intramembrane serine protease [Anoxybacillus sp.]MCL6585412.1 rhomboid family intramembrane serine protease [Anoxybacillus sp.]
MFIRTESPLTFVRSYPIVSTIVAVHILAFLFATIPHPLADRFLDTFVGFNAAIAEGEYWRLATSLFLHVQFGHVVANSFSLLLFGPMLEKMIGKKLFLLTYIGSGILANVATFCFAPIIYSHLGASGAIFGILGVYSYLAFFHRQLVRREDVRIIFSALVAGFAMTFTFPHMNTIAHLFGFFSGAILAPFVAARLN